MEKNTLRLYHSANVGGILKGKFRNFIHRTIWLYLLGSVMLACVSAYEGFSFTTTFIYVFGVAILLSLIAIFASTLYISNKIGDISLIFNDESIHLLYHQHGKKVEKSWDYIKYVSEKEKHFIISIKGGLGNSFFLLKNKIPEEQLHAFKTILRNRGKLR